MSATCFCGCGRPIPRTPLGLRSVNKRGRLVAERLAWLHALIVAQPAVGAPKHPDAALISALLRDGDVLLEELRAAMHGKRDPRALDESHSGNWLKAARTLDQIAENRRFPKINAWLKSDPDAQALVTQLTQGTYEATRGPASDAGSLDPQETAEQRPPRPDQPAWDPASDAPGPSAPAAEPREEESPEERRIRESSLTQVEEWLCAAFGTERVTAVRSADAFVVETDTNELPIVAVRMADSEPIVVARDHLRFEDLGVEPVESGTLALLALAASERNAEVYFTKWELGDDALTVETSIRHRAASQDELHFLVEAIGWEILEFRVPLLELLEGASGPLR